MGNRSRADIRRGVHSRIRKKVSGTEDRPRLAVFRSARHIYAQVIDDVSGKTLASASSLEKGFSTKGGNIEGAAAVGKALAEKAIGAGVSAVVYDRGGFLYHGRVKALIDATREAGLNSGAGATPAKAEETTDDSSSEEE